MNLKATATEATSVWPYRHSLLIWRAAFQNRIHHMCSHIKASAKCINNYVNEQSSAIDPLKGSYKLSCWEILYSDVIRWHLVDSWKWLVCQDDALWFSDSVASLPLIQSYSLHTHTLTHTWNQNRNKSLCKSSDLSQDCQDCFAFSFNAILYVSLWQYCFYTSL